MRRWILLTAIPLIACGSDIDKKSGSNQNGTPNAHMNGTLVAQPETNRNHPKIGNITSPFSAKPSTVCVTVVISVLLVQIRDPKPSSTAIAT